MLKKKYYTSELTTHDQREPIILKVSQQPTRFRNIKFMNSLSNLTIKLGWLKFRKKLDETKKAILVKEVLEEYGGFWIKVGQLLSMRTDLFSKEFCSEMSKLQDRSYGFVTAEAEAIIQEDIGCTLKEVFSIFEDTPIAAASLSQVHKAKLRQEETWVAVKVQKPYSDLFLKYDMKLFKGLFAFMGLFNLTKDLYLEDMVWELNQMMTEELDFRYEASNTERMRASLKPHKIYAPKVFEDYSSRRVLVMEWLHGVTVSEFIKEEAKDAGKVTKWLDANNIEPQKVGRKLIQSHLRQIFEDNLYHGDLHPGNIMMLAHNQLALIDFGNVGTSDVEFLNMYKQYILATASKQWIKASDLLFLLLNSTPPIDLTNLKTKLNQHLRATDAKMSVKSLPYHEKSLSANSSGVDRLFLKNKVGMDYSMLKIGRALGALDLTLAYLDPDMSYNKTFTKYGLDHDKRMQKKRLMKLFRLPEMIENAAAIISPLIRRDAINLKGTLTKNDMLNLWFLSRISNAIWLFLIYIIWTYLFQHHNSLVNGFYQKDNWLTKLVRLWPMQETSAFLIIIFITLYTLVSLGNLRKKYAIPNTIRYR